MPGETKGGLKKKKVCKRPFKKSAGNLERQAKWGEKHENEATKKRTTPWLKTQGKKRKGASGKGKERIRTEKQKKRACEGSNNPRNKGRGCMGRALPQQFKFSKGGTKGEKKGGGERINY